MARPKPAPEDIATKVRTPTGPETSAVFEARVTSGPDAGQVFVFDGETPPRVLVGQGPACAIRLTDPHASRRHAALEWAGDALRVVDLGSTNGTFANGLRVAEAFLRGGEVLALGDTLVSITRRGEARVHSDEVQFGAVYGASTAMRRLYPLCKRLASSSVPVVVEGETGTGKEVLAESIHDASPRSEKPFVIFDCTTVTPSLLESELFGHEKGAFTGALATRRGVFEQADGGTLFIDEIGDLELALQAKLLRAIEKREIRRVGGDRWIKVDVRVVVATRRDLDAAVEQGRFRDDLFFRLAVGRIELPPLRRREGDVAFLGTLFWRALVSDGRPMPPELMKQLVGRHWPGNVRELQNFVARVVALGDLASTDEAAGAGVAEARGGSEDGFLENVLVRRLAFREGRRLVLEHFERSFVERALLESAGDNAKAAAATGVGVRYFQMLRARYGAPREGQ